MQHLSVRSARYGAPARRATWGPCSTSSPQRTRRRGPRKASPALIRWTQGRCEARPRRVRRRFDQRWCLQVARRAGRAQREERAERCCIEPLCFGDFHLGPQMKVTRPPGRDPAGNAVNQTAPKRGDGQRPHWAESRRPACVKRVWGRFHPRQPFASRLSARAT